MRIVVFGASGGTGRLLVARALEAGHEVTAFVRGAAKAPSARPGLRVAVGEVTSDPEAVAAAVAGQDAVLSALGSDRTLRGLLAPRVHARAVPNIVAAMRTHGVGRVVYQSSLGVGDSFARTPAALRLMYRPALSRVFADKAAGERVLRASGLDWTLIYPVLLTNGPRTGTYRAGEDLELSGAPRVSREDVADLMLKEAAEPAHHRKIVTVRG